MVNQGAMKIALTHKDLSLLLRTHVKQKAQNPMIESVYDPNAGEAETGRKK